MLGLIRALMALIAAFVALKCCLENHRFTASARKADDDSW